MKMEKWQQRVKDALAKLRERESQTSLFQNINGVIVLTELGKKKLNEKDTDSLQ